MLLVIFAFAEAYALQLTPQSTSTQSYDLQSYKAANDSVKPKKKRFMVDGVSGVIGDYVILNSDIAKEYAQIKRMSPVDKLSKCEIMESILQQKMYAHHAIQDSINVSDAEVESVSMNMMEGFKRQLGGVTDDYVVKFYRKKDRKSFINELNEINRDRLLAQRMQERLTDAVTITPEEVRQFFYSLPEDQRPLFNTEVELAQIVMTANASEESEQEAIDKLNKYRKDVLENGDSFAAKAAVFSDDGGTEKTGGVISLGRNDPYVKEFKDAAFSLSEGEVSEPFKTQFGYHILYLQKIRGQIRDVRHILIIPFVSNEQLQETSRKMEEVREKIILGELTFEEAAKKYSEQEQTKENGGRLINPATGGFSLDLTKAPEDLVSKIQFLESGDVSPIIQERDETNAMSFRIIKMINKIEDHPADYAQDYIKIRELALRDKKSTAIKKWQQDKLKDTYIKIGDDFETCDFLSNWVK